MLLNKELLARYLFGLEAYSTNVFTLMQRFGMQRLFTIGKWACAFPEMPGFLQLNWRGAGFQQNDRALASSAG